MFLKPAFFAFRNHNLIQFFETQGLNFTIENRGRVFPVTNKAFSVVRVLREYLVKNKVEISYNARVVKLERKDNLFQLVLDRSDNHMIYAEKVILSNGGASYKKTGSSGDGFRIAEALGHTIVDLRPALIPFKNKREVDQTITGTFTQGCPHYYKMG